MTPLWSIRLLFLGLCILGGYAVSQVRPEYVGREHGEIIGIMIGFGFGGLLIDRSGLFDHADDKARWLVRLCLFLSFSYIGMILAMRSNKEDFSLIIPYVRFSPQNKPDNLLLLDTSVIIDGRVADLIEARFIEGLVVVPRFVLLELQQIADSTDEVKRARGRRGFEMLNRLQHNTKIEVRIHDGDFPEEKGVDAKLVRLARGLNAKLYTNDYNLAKVAGLQNVICVNLHEISHLMKAALIPGEIIQLKVVREGRDKGQGLGYLPDGTMVIVNNGQEHLGQTVSARVLSTVQTGAGILVFAEVKAESGK